MVWTHVIRHQPAPAYGVALYAVDGTDPGNVWVLGEREPVSGPISGVARRWDGAAWVEHDRPATVDLWRGFADAGTAVWVSGQFDFQAIGHWDGSSWSLDAPKSGFFAGTPSDLYLLQQNNAADAAKLGWWERTGGTWGSLQQTAVSGATWTALTVGNASAPFPMHRLAAQDGAGNLWLLGYGTRAGVGGTRGAWTLSGGILTEQWAVTTPHIWQAAFMPDTSHYYTLSTVVGTPRVQLSTTINPAAFVVQTIPAGTWNDLDGVSASDWWLLAPHTAAHWNGSAYTTYTLPTPWGSAFFWQAQALRVLSSTDVWAAGYAQQISGGLNAGIVYHWDGATWSLVAIFTS